MDLKISQRSYENELTLLSCENELTLLDFKSTTNIFQNGNLAMNRCASTEGSMEIH